MYFCFQIILQNVIERGKSVVAKAKTDIKYSEFLFFFCKGKCRLDMLLQRLMKCTVLGGVIGLIELFGVECMGPVFAEYQCFFLTQCFVVKFHFNKSIVKQCIPTLFTPHSSLDEDQLHHSPISSSSLNLNASMISPMVSSSRTTNTIIPSFI